MKTEGLFLITNTGLVFGLIVSKAEFIRVVKTLKNVII
jgi:hypothetical protein